VVRPLEIEADGERLVDVGVLAQQADGGIGITPGLGRFWWPISRRPFG
jgi:hypothetical protein